MMCIKAGGATSVRALTYHVAALWGNWHHSRQSYSNEMEAAAVFFDNVGCVETKIKVYVYTVEHVADLPVVPVDHFRFPKALLKVKLFPPQSSGRWPTGRMDCTEDTPKQE
jgi:hypothetical protein